MSKQSKVKWYQLQSECRDCKIIYHNSIDVPKCDQCEYYMEYLKTLKEEVENG